METAMTKASNKRLWIVVKVEGGIPVQAEAYQDRIIARSRIREMRKEMNEERDETGLFLSKLGIPSSEPVQ